MSCVFCDLQKKGELILWQDEHTYLILDINPLSHGHLLLIVKQHAPFLHNLSDDVLERVLKNVKKIVVDLGYEKYNILQNNGHIQSVPHVHFHIIPANAAGDSLNVNWIVQHVGADYITKTMAKVKKALGK